MEIVGGYRLVRKLGSGERGDVYLGYAASQRVSGPVAVKVFRGSTGEHSIAAEIAVLAKTSSRHLLRLVDVATAPDGRPCAILPRLSTASLARLLAERSTLSVGESITILAPLCAAVSELHAVRSYHGAIRPTTVLFDHGGAPVLACFGRAGSFGDVESAAPATVAEQSSELRVGEDLTALANVAELVLGRVDEGDTLHDVLSWLRQSGPVAKTGRFAEELAERVFDLGDAAPVDFGHPLLAGVGAVPARIVASVPDFVTATTAGPAAASTPRLLPKVLRRLTATVTSRLAPNPNIVEKFVQLRTVLASVRKPFWIAGIAGVVALTLALSLSQLSAGADAAARHSISAPRARASPSKERQSAPSSAASPLGSDMRGGVGKQSEKKAAAAVLADDPVAAAEVLLATRDECIHKRSLSCLDGVDQKDSAARADDSYLIRSLLGGTPDAPVSFSGVQITLTERLGDSALLSLQGGTLPATEGMALLMVKSDSGWRIRDFLGN